MALILSFVVVFTSILVLSYRDSTITTLPDAQKPEQSDSAFPTPEVTPIQTKIPEPHSSFVDYTTSSRQNRNQNSITIISPQKVAYKTSNLSFQVNVTSYSWAINSVSYQTDWLAGNHQVFNTQQGFSTALIITVDFTEIPSGSHHIEVFANLHNGMQLTASVDFSTSSP